MKTIQLLLLFTLLFNSYSYSQTYRIDLSKSVNETEKRTIKSNQSFEILIDNKIPLKDYSIEIKKKAIPIDAISLPTESKEIETSGGGMARCAEFIENFGLIYEVEKEEDMPSRLKIINKEIKEIEKDLTNTDITDEGCMSSHIEQAKGIIDLTSKNIGEWKLKKGEQLEIIITRVIDSETRKWTQIYSAGPRGEWQISYGFSFITQGFNKEDIFYSMAKDSAYTITKENNRKSLNFAPSLFFSWMPAKSLNKTWGIGLSGGLGFDFENPTVFLSPTISYNQNIKIHIGIVAHKQKVLLGKYDESQVISENLDNAQLHEELYKLNPFVSISFRFDRNPFQQDK